MAESVCEPLIKSDVSRSTEYGDAVSVVSIVSSILITTDDTSALSWASTAIEVVPRILVLLEGEEKDAVGFSRSVGNGKAASRDHEELHDILIVVSVGKVIGNQTCRVSYKERGEIPVLSYLSPIYTNQSFLPWTITTSAI